MVSHPIEYDFLMTQTTFFLTFKAGMEKELEDSNKVFFSLFLK